MGIIKNKDIYDKAQGNPVKELTKNLNDLLKVEKKLVTENKALAESLSLIKKSGDGAEARKLSEATDKLTKSTKATTKAKTASQIASEKLIKLSKVYTQTLTPQARAIALVKEQTLQANKALKQQAKATLGVRKGISGMTKSLIGSLGLVGGMMAFVNVLKNAFKISVTFGKETSRLSAILGKNKKDIKALTSQAKELGATTAFTASEVIKLQTELAKLGFSLKEIEASTPGILNLAAATGTDLASAAELAGATLRIFNLDASEMGRVTDVLAKSTTISSLSMEKLATIMPTVGKTAQIAGVSLEKTAALAGTLTDRGLDASSAATSLRNIFLELSKKGLTWNEAMAKINNSTDKNKTSMDLFGKRAAAAGVILSETADDTDKLTMSLNDADGAAQKMADTMLDNLSGDITKANSAWEGFVLSLSDGTGVLSSAFRSLTQGFASFLGGLQKINEESFGTKLKVMANGVLSVVNAISFGGLDNALKNVTQSEEAWRFDTDKQTEALKEESAIIEKNTKVTDKNTQSKKDNTKVKKSTRTETGARGGGGGISDSGEILGFTLPEGADGGIDPVKFNEDQNDKKLKSDQKYLDDKQSLVDADNAETVRKANEVEGAILQIKDAAIGAAGQILADSISFGIDAQAAAFEAANEAEAGRNAEKAEADKEILRQNLEEGLITEQEFKDQSAKIDEDLRAKNEKLEKETKKQLAIADKKKALFDVGIATAVGIARVIPNPVAMALAATLGAIQLAVVAARPIPKFAKGGEVGGESHANGGTLIEAEKKEFILSKKGYAGAEGISDLINKGLLKDSDIAMMNNSDYSPAMLQLNGLIDELKANGNIARETNKMLSKTSNVYERNGLVVFEDINGNVLKSLTKN